MYRNKNNGKLIKEVIFEKKRVFFVIDGIKDSLDIDVFNANYEKI